MRLQLQLVAVAVVAVVALERPDEAGLANWNLDPLARSLVASLANQRNKSDASHINQLYNRSKLEISVAADLLPASQYILVAKVIETTCLMGTVRGLVESCGFFRQFYELSHILLL